MMKHSTYFDGAVQSLSVNTTDGIATVGVMEPGRYTFHTGHEEHMAVTTGSLTVERAGSETKVYGPGESFIVPAGSAFDVECDSDVSYICYYK
jgi:uncharacterized protein YaiE (UPF0345 family)